MQAVFKHTRSLTSSVECMKNAYVDKIGFSLQKQTTLSHIASNINKVSLNTRHATITFHHDLGNARGIRVNMLRGDLFEHVHLLYAPIVSDGARPVPRS